MNFRDIPGQTLIKKSLVNAVQKQRVSHAQLYTGPPGTGKLAMAIAYAQYLNCTDKQGNEPCGTCKSCVKYNKLAHPDLHFIMPVVKAVSGKKDFVMMKWRELLLRNKGFITLNEWYNELGEEAKQGFIYAEDCNEIIHTLNYTSYESVYKVMIIWMADRIYPAAAPKILKILEEPPERTLFILISEHPEQLIGTIRSRCQVIPFPRLKNEEIIKGLNINANTPEGKQILNRANGNFKEALELQKHVDEREPYFYLFRDWFRVCYRLDLQNLFDWINKFATLGRVKQKAFFLYGLDIVRAVAMMNYMQTVADAFHQEEQTFIKNLQPFISEKNIIPFYEYLNEAVYHIERNAHPKPLMLDLSVSVYKLLTGRK